MWTKLRGYYQKIYVDCYFKLTFQTSSPRWAREILCSNFHFNLLYLIWASHSCVAYGCITHWPTVGCDSKRIFWFQSIMFVVNFRSMNAWMQFVACGWMKMPRGCSKIAVFWITLYNPASALTFCSICERPFQRTEKKQEVVSMLVEKKDRLQMGSMINLHWSIFPISSSLLNWLGHFHVSW